MLTLSLALLLSINPAIARGSGGTMAVWEQESRIHANGLVVAPESSNPQRTPDVAAIDNVFYVVWCEGFRAYGRVIGDGRALSPIADLGDAFQPPAVAADLEGFVVLLHQTRQIDIVHVSVLGTVLRHEPLNVFYITPPPSPAIGCNGSNCAMAWLESDAPNGCNAHSCQIDAEVRARRMGGNTIDVARVDPGVNHLAVAMKPDGDFAVAWSTATTTSFALIEGDRVVRSNASLFGTRPSLDWDGSSYIAARNAGGDIIGTRIGSEFDVSDFTIAVTGDSERDADLAMPFVVYEREGSIVTRDLSAPPRHRVERFR